MPLTYLLCHQSSTVLYGLCDLAPLICAPTQYCIALYSECISNVMCLDPTYIHFLSVSTLGSLFSSADRLFSADVTGSMHLWTVDHGDPHSLPVVSLLSSMEVPRGVFSACFDNKLELVRTLSSSLCVECTLLSGLPTSL